MSAWNQLVSKLFKEGRSKNNDYKLKNAMQDASKIYKKGSTTSTSDESSNRPTKKCRSLRKRANKACNTKRRRKSRRR
jgi:hypothetical protein